MRILITEGTGFVGSILIEAWHDCGHEVTVFGRSIKKERRLPNRATVIEVDATRPGPWWSTATN